jgi:probable F420-dependent oxidoreductase
MEIMKPGSIGAFLFPDSFTGPELAALAQRFESLGYAALWYPEVFYYESFTLGGFLLSQTKNITVASGIANIYARDAMATVQAGRSLRAFHGERFILGLGVSHESIVTGGHGHAYGKPLSTMRDYLDAMDRARPHLAGEDSPLILAALGPKMIALAGERSMGAHPYNSPPEHTRWAREILGPDKWLCTAQHVCFTEDAGLARAAARRALEFYFVTPNHYRNWLRVGYTTDDLENGGSDRLIDALVAWGTEAQIRDRIRQHFDAGATQVILNTIRPEPADSAALAVGGRNYQSVPDWNALEILKPSSFA